MLASRMQRIGHCRRRRIAHRLRLRKGNSDTQNVNMAADTFFYAKTNELFVADGYGNRRIIVFDADTGAFKRM